MISESGRIKLRDEVELYTQFKEVGSPVWLVVVHGIGEHLTRHNYMLDLFAPDLNIFQFDLRGHGKSGGERAYVASFSEYFEDLDQVLTYLQEKYRMKRFVLFGHSMGAMIVAGFMQRFAKSGCYPEKIFLNAPPVGLPGALGELFRVAPIKMVNAIAALNVSLKLGGLVDLNLLSHDPLVAENYVNDELNCLKLHSKLLFSLAEASRNVFGRAIAPRCPAYCTVGSEDKIVNVKALKHYFTEVDKSFQLKVIDGAYHEIHNEIGRFKNPYFSYLKNSIMESLFIK